MAFRIATARLMNSFPRLKRGCAALVGVSAVATLSLFSSPALAGDPFRPGNEYGIGPDTEAAFEAFFKAGNYTLAEAAIESALVSESDEPLVHSLAASMAYLDGDHDKMAEHAELTKSAAAALMDDSPLRGHLYSAVGIFLEGSHMMTTQGVARSTPAALGMLQQVFGHLDEAERIDKTDPELNLVQGFMDLMLAVNLPFSNPAETIERLATYSSPDYLTYRGIALGYRDLNQIPEAMAAVEQALQAAPENPELFYLRAQLQRRQEQTTASLASFDKALDYAAQLPPGIARMIAKERCRTSGGASDVCETQADDFVESL
ncbi:MAG: Sll0314/Alr1548 family TPR repeat-containing protein [Cyanobacteria bacterium P01_D01_bin.1]